MNRRIYIFVLFWVFWLATHASAATYWVSKSGKDGQCTNSTTAQTSGAELTIASAVKCMSASDTLYIRTGTYAEQIYDSPPSGSIGTPTTISAYGSEIVTLQPKGVNNALYLGSSRHHITLTGAAGQNNLVFDCTYCNTNEDTVSFGTANNITISNADVRNAPGTGIGTGALTSGLLYNIKIHNNGSSTLSHGIYMGSSSNTIERCEIYSNSGYGIHWYSGGSGGHTDNNTAKNNAIHDNNQGGILMSSGTGNRVFNNLLYSNLRGIHLLNNGGSINGIIYNNTIYNNTVGVLVEPGNSGTLIKNNLFNSNGTDISDAGTTTTIDYNLCNAACGTNSQTGNPLFVSPGNNFQISSAKSPAVNNGTNLGSSYNTDYASISRPQGSGWDMGAYEYTVSVTVTINQPTNCQSWVVGNPSTCTMSDATVVINGSSSLP